MRQLSVRWAVAGMGLAAVTILALAAFSWNFARQTLAASTYVALTHKVMSSINDLEASLYRAEAGQRAYLPTLKPVFREERDAAVKAMEQGLRELEELTADNPVQAKRIESFRRELAVRIALYRQSDELLVSNADYSPADRMAMGAQVLSTMRPLIDEMTAEEGRLLKLRERTEVERSASTAIVFAVFIALLLVLLPLIFWRMQRDLGARHRAEAHVAEERRYDALHARALTLYNAENDREAVLAGTLELLADTPLFPVGAFYAHDEWGGALRLVASHAAPPDIKPLLRVGEGAIGSAARGEQPVYIDGFDAEAGLSIETGLAALKPASLLMSPVRHHGRLLGVLALAASAKLAERDRAFVARLCSQLAVALHNLGQLEELMHLTEQLRARGEDIQQKNAELERASRMKSEFLANMSHELRTPLNAIIGFSEIMKDGLAGALAPEQQEYVSDIYTSGRHLLSLINDILDLSKVESGHVPLELEAMEPAMLAESALSVLRERAAAGRVRLTTACPPDQGRLLADVRKAKQIVYNLLSNALKFTPENGSVTLSLEPVAAREIRALEPNEGMRLFPPSDLTHSRFLEIRVSDTGIGITPAGLRQLFEAFVQIDSSLSRQYAGTGLGLTLVKRLAELHGGGVMVRSTVGEGSTFTVWLPWRPVDGEVPMLDASLAPVEELAATAQATSLVTAHEPARLVSVDEPAPLVLVVEDDPRAAHLMQVQLQSQGYRVEFARTAEEGLARAAQLDPAALVLDIILPGMDGWDMLARLKDGLATRNIPVVIVSITDETRRGFALGAAQVLVKPVSKEDLLAAMAASGLGQPSPDVHVMVVDDDPKSVTLVSKHLQTAGYTAVAAYGGQEALEFARHKLPALIILDLMMPQVSGFDVVDRLRSRPETADIPIIVLTAKMLTHSDRVQLQGRVQRVMEKADFQSTSLLAEVKRALVRRRPMA